MACHFHLVILSIRQALCSVNFVNERSREFTFLLTIIEMVR
jgi:hypothetical protein